jgi:hypothetical protein
MRLILLQNGDSAFIGVAVIIAGEFGITKSYNNDACSGSEAIGMALHMLPLP